MSKKQEEKLTKSSFALKNVFLIVLIFLMSLQYIQMRETKELIDDLSQRDSSLITEIGQLKESFGQFSENINEVRRFLRMPEFNFAFEDPIAEEKGGSSDDAKNENQVQVAMFTYLEYLNKNSSLQEDIGKKTELLNGLKASEELNKFLGERELALGTVVDGEDTVKLAVNTAAGEEVAVYYVDKIDGALYVKTALDEKTVGISEQAALETEVKTFIADNKDALIELAQSLKAKKEQIAAAVNGAEVQTFLSEKSVSIDGEPEDKDLKYIYAIKNVSDEVVGEVVLDQKTASIELRDMENVEASKMASSIETELLPFLQTLQTETYTDRKVREAKSNIENTIKNDSGFKAFLGTSKFKITDTPREDDSRYYYDITNEAGELVSSIVVEKATAVVNIVDENGTNSENLLFFDPEFKKKTLEIPDQVPEFDEELAADDESFNILIAGKNGNLVDTMIFAHLDEKRGKVRMVSIPRDLQYNGRKINSYAYFYGMDELKRVLSNLTGYELDKYILIDMYAFIDVIDLIGGIDVTLDKPLIDPTYRTVDNGVVGTLHYDPGTYHLGGKEALRLARSRYTSSDFARAERQQLILQSIQAKAQNFGFGDADTLYDIAKTVLSKTESDIDIDDALVYYFKYQNYDIESNAVMSSGNVLYSPPYISNSQCDAMIAAAEAAGQPNPGCRSALNAYVLMPKNNNWNLIKWFFQQEFEGDAAA